MWQGVGGVKLRDWWIGFAAANCALPLAWAVKPGEPAPDLALRDCRGAEVRLSDYRRKKHAVVLAQAPGVAPATGVDDDACRRLAALDSVALFLPGDAEAKRDFLGSARSATLLIDSEGVVRRALPGRVLTGPDLAGFVELWLSGKTVFSSACARCHGQDGDSNICLDVKPLAGIGRRLSETEIRERLRPGVVNDKDMLIRGQIFSRQEVDAVIVYIAGL
jgi:hypothetical protein